VEFEWKRESDYLFVLHGYYDSVIAILTWNNDCEVWELSSDWLDCSADLDIELGKEDIDKVKSEAIDELKRACEEHIGWYKGQIEMLNELKEDK